MIWGLHDLFAGLSWPKNRNMKHKNLWNKSQTTIIHYFSFHLYPKRKMLFQNPPSTDFGPSRPPGKLTNEQQQFIIQLLRDLFFLASKLFLLMILLISCITLTLLVQTSKEQLQILGKNSTLGLTVAQPPLEYVKRMQTDLWEVFSRNFYLFYTSNWIFFDQLLLKWPKKLNYTCSSSTNNRCSL